VNYKLAFVLAAGWLSLLVIAQSCELRWCQQALVESRRQTAESQKTAAQWELMARQAVNARIVQCKDQDCSEPVK
jgi:hypothetical protein